MPRVFIRLLLEIYLSVCQILNGMSTGRMLMDPLINIIALSTVPSEIWASVLLLPGNIEAIVGPWDNCSGSVAQHPNDIKQVHTYSEEQN